MNTSGISDEDGLENVSFEYQWLVAEEPISGETGPTYTPAETGAGKTVSVRVTFTDDAGHSEEVTSASTAPVEPKQTQPGAPQSVTVSPGGTGEFDVSWDPPTSDGGSEIITYIVRWKESSGSWNSISDAKSESVSGTSHTITGLTAGTEYTVRVLAFNIPGGGPESEEITAVSQ